MVIELTAIEIVFLISILFNFLAVLFLDRTRIVLKAQTDIHSSEANKYHDQRTTFQGNYERSLVMAKTAVEGFERMSNSMDHFMKHGSWPKPETIPSNVTPLSARAPAPKDDEGPPTG